MAKGYLIVICLTLVLLGALWMPSTVSSDAPPHVEIPVTDIGSKVTLVGRLGKSLGVMMKLKGRWAFPDTHVKDFSLRFIVTEVDSKQLAQPIEFNVAQINAVFRNGTNAIPVPADQKSLDGVQWVFRAYETGRVHVEPDEYWNERGSGPHASPYWFKPFTSELVGVVD